MYVMLLETWVCDEVLYEVKWYACMSMYAKSMRYEIKMQCYAHKNACQVWYYACLTEMRIKKWA